MVKELRRTGKSEDILDILISLLFNLEESRDLNRETDRYKPIPAILDQYRKKNGTIGGLLDAFSSMKQEYEQNNENDEAAMMASLVKGMEDILNGTTKLAKE